MIKGNDKRKLITSTSNRLVNFLSDKFFRRFELFLGEQKSWNSRHRFRTLSMSYTYMYIDIPSCLISINHIDKNIKYNLFTYIDFTFIGCWQSPKRPKENPTPFLTKFTFCLSLFKKKKINVLSLDF